MKVAVYPHDLGMGGSQLNAIELAAGVQQFGHEVVVVGRPGTLVSRIEELGLEFVELPAPVRRPSRRVAAALAELSRRRGLDLIHGYEWPPTLEAEWAARMTPGLTVTSTVMSMAVAPFIPTTVPLVVGTEEIGAAERSVGRELVEVIEPPVDLIHNDPALVSSEAAHLRRRWGIDDGELLVVTVTRLAAQLKLEGLLTAIDVCASLAASHPVRLLIVGDGPARAEVQQRVAAANARAGREVVQWAGELGDPRAAYAAADIAIGMGGSALRALAFGRPLIVQGEQGFFRVLEPSSIEDFLWTGWYGRGSDAAHGAGRLHELLVGLVADADRRVELGRVGQELVHRRFSLERASRLQADAYERARADRPPARAALVADAVAGARYVQYYVGKRWRRWRGTEAVDDFNARPIVVRPADRGPVAPDPVLRAGAAQS